MRSALIGYTGYVGSTLLRQSTFSELYRSTNISDIAKERFDLIVCAGAPAQKWLANREPEADAAQVGKLIQALEGVTCENFVLISTVDVFAQPLLVDEKSEVNLDGLHAYGRNRRLLEVMVQRKFPKHCIIRLPGLVGPGLKKNVLYDILNKNNLTNVDSRAVFQFYPMVNLRQDIRICMASGESIVHLTSEPVSVREVAEIAFNQKFDNELAAQPARYDFRTRYAAGFGGAGHYQYSRRESLLAITAYAQSEPQSLARA
jgi:nucleoside-diphosphate-sugar epimerase